MTKGFDKTKIKNDSILLAVLVIVSLIMIIILRSENTVQGDYALITLDGGEYARLPLSEDTSLCISTDKGTNNVRISGGEVFVESADCPDQICVNHAHIRYKDETIVCLPHRLVITIVTDKEPKTDAISQ